MASPGVKRPLDIDSQVQHTSANCVGSNGTSTIAGGTNPNNVPALTNGANKRRCPTTNFPASQIKAECPINANQNNLQQVPDSPFKDLATLVDNSTNDVSILIQDELNRANENHVSDGDEIPILTARQTQSICEKLIKIREQKMRDEYDRILACKLAEQHDLLTKANYLNSYVGATTVAPAPVVPRLPHNNHAPAVTATNLPHPNTNQAVSNHQSINALAAAFTSMQRSAAAAAAAASTAPHTTSPTLPATTNPGIPDLSAIAASLTANSHQSVITSQLAYNLQQQAAAIQQAQHQSQNHTQLQRAPSNASTIPLGPVLLASNLDEQLAIPEALFTLFGVFGDVVRVKILFNKKDNALIQMADANQAQVAQGYLDKQKVYGKIIRVTRSKHQLVQMPREGNQSDAGLTKDFTNSPLHRFKFPGSRNYLNIYPPSNTLHISNVPATIDEGDLHKAFKEQCGFEHMSFKFFPKDRKMALMRFNSIEHATIALIKMHNFPISDENNLRVSFSKSVMQ